MCQLCFPLTVAQLTLPVAALCPALSFLESFNFCDVCPLRGFKMSSCCLWNTGWWLSPSCSSTTQSAPSSLMPGTSPSLFLSDGFTSARIFVWQNLSVFRSSVPVCLYRINTTSSLPERPPILLGRLMTAPCSSWRPLAFLWWVSVCEKFWMSRSPVTQNVLC